MGADKGAAGHGGAPPLTALTGFSRPYPTESPHDVAQERVTLSFREVHALRSAGAWGSAYGGSGLRGPVGMRTLMSSDRGMTRLESNIVAGVLIIGLAVGFAVLFRTYSTTLGETEHATVQDGQPFRHEAPAEPIAVNVVAAGTIAQPLDARSGSGADSCADLPGVQPSGFDCALPIYAPALDLAASHLKGRYQCADHANYQLVGGQAVEADKRCILKTVAEVGS